MPTRLARIASSASVSVSKANSPASRSFATHASSWSCASTVS
jgi:hypothetical protein